MKSTVITNLSVYGITHAIVDATCAGIVFSNLQSHLSELDYFLFLIILYNILAFGLQAPFGAVVDKIQKPVPTAILGCILTAAGAILFKSPFIAVIFAGVGNALFHIGGGIVSLNMNNGKASIPGIYVAPGALGLFIGGLIGKGGYFNPLYFVALLLNFNS